MSCSSVYRAIVQDLLSALAYPVAVFAIIAYVFDLPIQGLLVTSGAIAIVLGLALQSTLNDVFSGLVLSLSHPYRPGNSIALDGGTEGQIVEMNWRATHILTGRRDLAILPNSTIAKSKIVNLNFPSGIHGITVTVALACPPASGVSILELAVLNSRSILATPRPAIRTLSIDAAQTGYEITFFVERLGSSNEAQNELLDLIYRHVVVSGARLAPPRDGPYAQDQEAAKTERSAAERALDLAAIFETLTPKERAALGAKLRRASYETGEILVKPTNVLHSLFIVGKGVLSLARLSDGEKTELLRFGPGDHFGEAGMLTGAAAGAIITALSPCVVHELAKEDLAPILEGRPQIAEELSHALAQRQSAGRAMPAAGLDKANSPGGLSSWFAQRIHSLFDVTDADR